MTNPELTIRPARPDDRSAMERICAHTWDWGDYIPEVWDEWLAAEGGGATVGELGGQVVALSKITFQPSDQVWLEGMRVDPDYRRRGIAGRFLYDSIAYAGDQGARVVRLATSSKNTPVHIIAARAGMHQVGTYVMRVAEMLPDGAQPDILTPDRAKQVQSFVQNSPVLDYTCGLYCAEWAWQELSAERVLQFLQDGRVAAQVAEDGGLDALAALHIDAGGEEMWVSFTDGQPAAVNRLAMAIRALAARSGVEELRAMLPDVAWLRDCFRAAGYGPGDWEGELLIFERWLIDDRQYRPGELGRGSGGGWGVPAREAGHDG